MIVQTLSKKLPSEFEIAEKYFSLISAINDLALTQREIQLLAFTAVKGNMTYGNVKEEFCKRYNTTSPTINNIVSKLKRMGLIVKNNGKISVTAILVLDFNKDIVLNIKLHKNGIFE